MKKVIALLLPLALAGCLDDSPTTPDVEKRIFSLLGGLELGEVLDLRGPGAKDLPLSGGSEYLIVPFYGTSEEGEARLSVALAGENLEPIAGAASRVRVPLELGGIPTRPVTDRSFHDRLRLRERALAGKIPEARLSRAGARGGAAAVAVPRVGDVMRLNANPNSACSSPDYRDARVVAVSERAIVAVDVSNPAGGLSDAEYNHVAATFDTLVWKVNTRSFGMPTDIDQNGRSIIFYTSAVNALTPANSDGGYVAGFFFSRDLFPATGPNSCPGSNFAEMFYMLTPDPTGSINGNRFSRDLVLKSTIGTTAHEMEHLINASRRIYLTDATDFEENWLDEGLAHIAEEQVFYESSGLAPGSNIDSLAVLQSPRTRNAANLFLLDNLVRYWLYLESPTEESLLGVDTKLETRGAIWSFLRYAADRKGGSSEAFFKALVDSPRTGVPNLAGVLGEDPIDLMQSWTVSVYMDDLGTPGAPERFSQKSWNMRSLIGFFNDGEFPLEVLALGTSGSTTVGLKGGGAAFITVESPPGRQGIVRATADNRTPPDALRISVVRIR